MSSVKASVTEGSDEQAARLYFSQMQQSSNPVIANLARETLQRLHGNQASGHRTKVEVKLLTQQNDSLAVPVLLDTQDHRQVMATFLVDTGASYTVITPRLAAKLGVLITANTPRVAILTANGMVQSPKVTVPKLSLGGVSLQNIEVLVQDLGGDLLLSGLLGMNAFKGMELTVQADRLILGVNAS
jgi:clan AA aspartic protease (TIGR02281 family)